MLEFKSMVRKYMKRLLLIPSVLLCISAYAEPLDMSCSEAAEKVTKIDSISHKKSISYYNFLTQVHHSENSHSLNIRSRPQAMTTFHKYSSKKISPYERHAKVARSLAKEMNALINDNKKYISFSPKISKLVAVLMEKAELKKYTPEQLEQGIKLSDSEAKKLKYTAEDYYDRLLILKTTFNARIVKDDSKGLVVVFYWQESCEPDTKPTTVVSAVNNQNIKFLKECHGAPPKQSYAVLTPSTEKGLEFIVSEFKKRTWVEVPIQVNYETYPVKFWANGFTKTWNAAGGNAL